MATSDSRPEKTAYIDDRSERGVGRDSTLFVLLSVGLNADFFFVVETALAGARAVLMQRLRAAAALDLRT